MARTISSRNKLKVTEHEGMLLALVIRKQPVTAYQLFKLYEQSPITSINSSKGQLYPAIRRLKSRRLLTGRKVTGDRRNSEELSATSEGHAVAREWTMTMDAPQIVLDDPLRTRVFSFDLLTREERLEWIANAKALIKERRDQIDEYDRSVEVPYQEFAYRSVTEILRIKMEWLDDLLYHVAASK